MASGIAVLALIVVIATIRVRRSDLAGATAAPTPAAEVSPQPASLELSQAAATD